MNPAALILGIAGSIVTVVAVASKPSIKALPALPPEPEPEPLPPPPPRALPTPQRRVPPPQQLQATTIPAHAVEVVDSAPANAIEASRSPRQAAQQLYEYVVPLIRNGRGSVLGTKNAPNEIVARAQQDMRIAVDGVYGPATRARGKELLGREFPAREQNNRVTKTPLGPTPELHDVAPPEPPPAPIAAPAPPPRPIAAPAAPPAPIAAPAPPPEPKLVAPPPPPLSVPVTEHSSKEAAEALLIYVKSPGANFGTKNAPSKVVHDAQLDMGLTADGIYGPATRDRGKKLTGKTFPPRR